MKLTWRSVDLTGKKPCSGRGAASSVNVFKDVCSKITPVLRHFFFERFEDPDDWFDRRLAYTRSTAAMSILGHVLGLGDRHCHNILLDTSTGEVVHIDLGRWLRDHEDRRDLPSMLRVHT